MTRLARPALSSLLASARDACAALDYDWTRPIAASAVAERSASASAARAIAVGRTVEDPKENSFQAQKGTHEANLMLASSNRSEASSVGGLSRLRTRSAAPWDGDSTPKLPLGGIQHCQPASSSSSRAVL